MAVDKIRSAFTTAQTQRKNDVVSVKELKAIVTDAKTDGSGFDTSEKQTIAALSSEAIANNKMTAAAQRELSKLQQTHGVYDTRPQPQWTGNAHSIIQRSGLTGAPITGPVTYDSWARQRAATRELRFEAWIPGLTDRDDPELWKKVDAKAHFRFAGETQYRQAFIDIKGRSGNNAIYGLDLMRFDPWMAKFTRSEVNGITPKLTALPNGDQQAMLEVFFTLNGKPVRPEGAAHFQVAFQDHGAIP